MSQSSRKCRCTMGLWFTLVCLANLTVMSLLGTDCRAQSYVWQRLDKGLFLGEFDPKKASQICNRKIAVLKIDPKFFSLELMSASQHDQKPRSAKEWCEDFGLLAAINASMYQNMEPLKSTGYMKNFGHFNNAHINPAFGAFLLFNPMHSSLPDAQIVDRRLVKNWKGLLRKYHTVVQNFRMISSGKKRGWPQRKQIHGTAAVGVDGQGNILFILSPSPYSVHDLIHILIALPINIRDAMYVEGGPEATLYFKLGKNEMGWFGNCTEQLNGSDDEEWAHPIPNVIGVVKRDGGTHVGGD